MRGIHSDGSEHGRHAPLVKSLCRLQCLRIELVHRQDADAVFRERGKKVVIPAFVLIADEHMHGLGHLGQFVGSGQAIRANFPRAVFDALEKAGDAHLDELVEVVGRNGQELHALKKRIPDVPGFFEDTAVELQPLHMAVEVVARIVEGNAFHRIVWGPKDISHVCYSKMNGCERGPQR